MGHGLLISLVGISLMVASFNASYAETTNYVYDGLNRLIRVEYEDGKIIEYTYDAAGNRLETTKQETDTTPPTGTIIINSGDAVTNNPTVTLTLTCDDNVGCTQMQFSNDNVTYSTPEPYGTTTSWTLLPGDGTKTVYARFGDDAENWSTAYTDTIYLDLYTKSLLHMNGTDGSTTFNDNAMHTWTAFGNAQVDTAQSKFGGASGLFDGNGDYIQTPYSADFDFGTEDFTWDLWVRWNALPTSGSDALITVGRMTNNNNVVVLYLSYEAATAKWRLYFVANVGGVTKAHYYTAALSFSNGTWYHLAVVRNGSNVYIFRNGTSLALTVATAIGTNSITLAVQEATTMGRLGNYTGYDFNGWIDECRISKGIARWTADFTPPTGEYSY